MKKSISMIATGLAAGALLTSSMINVPTIQAANVENSTSKTSSDDVDENGISESLKRAIAKSNKGITVDDVTPEYIGTLKDVNVSAEDVTDISGMKYAVNATNIDIGYNGVISDISELSGLDNLKTLSINGNEISDLTGISELTGLTSLHAEDSPLLSDIKPIKNLTNLTSLYLDGCAITDFDVLENFDSLDATSPRLVSNGIGGKIKGQSLILDSKQLNNNSVTIDLTDYIGKSSKTSIEDVTASLKDDNGDIVYNNTDKTVTVSGISSSNTLTISYNVYSTFNIEQDVPTTITQPYTIGDGNVVTKPVTMKIGDTWNDSLGFVSATDPFGDELTLEDFDVNTGILNTNEEGAYQVTYTSKDFPGITGTADVTVEKDNNTGGNNSGGNNNGSNTGDVSEIDEMLLTSKKTDSIAIYDANGNKTSDKTLSGVTDFTTTKKSVVNGVTYYQVGDDEWVKESDVAEYFEYSGTVQTNSDSIKKLSNLNGDSSNRGLAQTTDWQADRYAYINGNKSYRVSTNEWVAADQTLEITSVSGVLTINEEATLYHDNGKKSDRGLAANSTFVTDKTATINGEKMYRVSTNEWVPASQVTMN